ncbi:hypothetical protein C0Q70_14443 [Pomacea canaliculata]|uniref:Uncharacterized protein n=1 Tax=Pomacea canaliculata TaxID=400727 RepID=A0A2T7P034_POMCA|nr:hypothetical protein C0Q70_14443 [Pomacea canaliculata]
MLLRYWSHPTPPTHPAFLFAHAAPDAGPSPTRLYRKPEEVSVVGDSAATPVAGYPLPAQFPLHPPGVGMAQVWLPCGIRHNLRCTSWCLQTARPQLKLASSKSTCRTVVFTCTSNEL